MRLKNKVILVTGGYTGIGKAIVESCVSEGAKLLVNGLLAENGDRLMHDLNTENIQIHTQDITDESAAENLINAAIKAYGKLDAVVNNAAIIRPSNLTTTEPSFLRRMLEVNTIAPFFLIKEALPHLTKQGGCVVNIGSINAWSGEPNLLAYSISKGALMTLSRNLGDSLFRENGVRVNQINPGWVLTENEFINQREQGKKEDWHKRIPKEFAPANRLFKPKEMAAAAVYLLSDESGPISGQVLEVEQFPMIGRNIPKNW